MTGATFEQEGAAASRGKRNEAVSVSPGGGAQVASERLPEGQRRLRGFVYDPLALATLDPRRFSNVAAAPARQHTSRAALFERSEAETTRPNQLRLTPLQVRSTRALATLDPRRVEARQQ